MNSQGLRKTLSKFATGITVITTIDNQNNSVGVTVNSFTSVSLDPPIILWCLGDQTFALEAFLKAEHFVVNILSSNQQDISDNFATPGDFDRFAELSYSKNSSQIPVIDQCLGNLECSSMKIERIGDHWLFLCKVTKHNIANDSVSPLVYYCSQYQQINDSSPEA